MIRVAGTDDSGHVGVHAVASLLHQIGERAIGRDDEWTGRVRGGS